MLKQITFAAATLMSASTMAEDWHQTDTYNGSVAYITNDATGTALSIFDIGTVTIVNGHTFDINGHFMGHERENQTSMASDSILRIDCKNMEGRNITLIKELTSRMIILTPQYEEYHKFSENDIFADLCTKTAPLRAKFK